MNGVTRVSATERREGCVEVGRQLRLAFFARSWARYNLAVAGTFRLVPPDSRLAELERDYAEMRQMFLDDPVDFPDIMAALRELEQRINQGP